MWSDNESSLDLLGCQHLVDVVTSIIRNDSLLPTTIGVFGDWGSGKSSLLQIVRAELEQDEEILVLSFNGWTFEGYEDARTALMSTILDEVGSHATISAKGKRLAIKLLGRVNVMRVLGAGAKAAFAFGVGGPAGLGLSAGSDLATMAAELAKRAGELKEEELSKFLKEEPAQEIRRSIRDFRTEFEKLLAETRLKTLVVMIDDLDRCMPDTVIETLEAIKLFLFCHKTAFVLGADERLVKYAVRRRFPELPGERVEVGRDYLEKLVQFPVRIPPLGRTEIETYINILFAKTGGLTAEQFEAARRRAVICDARSLLDVRFNHGVAEEILGSTVPPELAENLLLAQRIAPFLASTSGYPRQCKRFLNMLVMRLRMAKSRNVELKQRVLAKLMLLEYFRPESFKKLAELQAEDQGRPTELALAEEAVRPKPPCLPPATEAADGEGKDKTKAAGSGGGKAKPARLAAPVEPKPIELPMWLSDQWTREWLSSEPMLAEEDLRPYFYFSRDTLGQLAVVLPRMSPLAQQVIAELFDRSEAVRGNALRKATNLNPAEAVSVFEVLAEKARHEEDPGDERSALMRLFDWAKVRPELLVQFFTLLESLPEANLPITVVPKVPLIAETSEHKGFAKRLLAKWAANTASMSLQGAAQSRLRNWKD